MEPQPLNRIAEWCGGRILNASPDLIVHGISTDSRSIKAGELFVAVSGEKFDGHDFLGDVCAKGAVAAVVEERRLAVLPPGGPFILVADARKALGAISAAYRRLFEIRAVAIAGSNGKTSTKEFV